MKKGTPLYTAEILKGYKWGEIRKLKSFHGLNKSLRKRVDIERGLLALVNKATDNVKPFDKNKQSAENLGLSKHTKPFRKSTRNQNKKNEISEEITSKKKEVNKMSSNVGDNKDDEEVVQKITKISIVEEDKVSEINNEKKKKIQKKKKVKAVKKGVEFVANVKVITGDNGVVYYSGELRDGLPHGRGKLDNGKNYSYVGSFNRGKKHGLGIEKLENGSVFDGEFQDGLRNKGMFKMMRDGKEVIFIGPMQEKGEGKVQYENGSIYIGEIHKLKRCGNGKLLFHKRNSNDNGDIKEIYGEWKDDKPNGVFDFITNEGVTIKGEFENGILVKEPYLDNVTYQVEIEE